jgi:hypothetical protein
MPETIWIIKTTDAKAPNMYQKFTFLGTGCFERWRSYVLTIGKRLFIQLKNPDDC